MAVQQHRVSKTRKRLRRTHFKLEAPPLVRCPQCGEYKLQHHVCPTCGTYKGRQVIAVK
ncbi:50S ribosomal protein L32 [Alicyclobacillus cellulosilyticus]|uniref:Large ribosomal subunit protein bL32 n=1 Tax=Alicyclobacillus cellulosilyticus TaxID=1003997 RepID=A0A917KDS1_9BACL|nr:50S ribosomal protein L32 [Alicyclobacillus cellulosilyticus]GGJ08052.1 50S ribosomal protein L32 [Alicyclobacillus cellulosilyticus]